jgi:HAD superfamily hydrolase (TIGR01490 family)
MNSITTAFFDLDNTIIPGPAIERGFFFFLWRHKLIGLREFAHSSLVLLRNGPPFTIDPLRRYKAYLSGKPAPTIEALARKFFWEHVCSRISDHARQAIEAHRTQHHRIALLTGCPDVLVEPLATYLKIDVVISGRLARNGPMYTGHMVEPYPYGDGKRIMAERLAQEHQFDLRTCYMYGDSPGDLSMLEAVGHPHVVNPIRGMGGIARQRQWPILLWQ